MLTSSIHSIKSDAQKQMIEFGFRRRCHGLSYLIFLEFIIYLRASSQIFVENQQINVILSYLKKILENHLFNITYLHTTCTVFWKM